MAEADGDVDVVENPQEGRFEALLDGELVGSAYYRHRRGRMILTHTEVDDAYEGRGIGSDLASYALDTVRSQGKMVVPLCPFMAGYIRRHEQYADLVDQELSARYRS